MPDGFQGLVGTSDFYDAETVIGALSDAGRTLMALRVRNLRPAGYGSGMPEYGHEEEDLVDQLPDAEKIDEPSAREVTHMDTVLAWIRLIPESKRDWRRVIGYRMLINPRTDKPVMSWKKIALQMKSDAKLCETVYHAGVDEIVRELNAPLIAQANLGMAWDTFKKQQNQ